MQSSLTTNRVPLIAVVASNGWVFRNLLETDLLLSAGLIDHVIFILDKRIAKNGASLLEAKGVRYVVVEFHASKALLWVKSFLLYLEVFRNAPRYSENKFRGPLKRIFLKILRFLHAFGLSVPFNNMMRFILEGYLKRAASAIALPDFEIFLSASPNALQDNIVAASSRHAGRPVANLILSWDNIYAKGYMVPADLYVVWGDVMAKQLTTLFGVRECQIAALGAPHIGGLRPQDGSVCFRDTLLYSTAAAVHFPDEKDLVSQLAKDFAAGIFPDFARFVIRTHPAGPNALYDDLADSAANIYVEHPTSLGNNEISQWVPDANELKLLGKQLLCVSVAVNMASTMSLDCLAHGISVINIAAALNGRDLSRHYRSEHYMGLVNLNLVHLVASYEDLVIAINDAVKTPDLAMAERVQSFIRPTDAEAIADFRSRLLGLSAVNVV